MSEFTDGLLVLREHAPLAKAALVELDHPHLFKHLNERWSVILLEDPSLRHTPARPWILRYSHDFPILSFHDAEDHGWGYTVFHKGDAKASLEVSYELSYGFWIQLVRILYPDIRDPHSDLAEGVSDQIYHMVYKSDGYQQAIKDQYTEANLDEFKIFGFSFHNIFQLRRIVRPEWTNTQAYYKQVDAFKEIIGIEEMSWVSYRYINCDDSQDRFEDV